MPRFIFPKIGLFFSLMPVLLVVVAGGLLMPLRGTSQTPTLEELEARLEQSDTYRGPNANFMFHVKVATPDARELGLTVRVQDRVKSLVQYTKPAKSRGRVILFVERNMWIYIPGTRRALRISPNQQVLGGVSSADVARTVLSVDYRPTQARTIDQAPDIAIDAPRPFQELTLEPRHSGTAYAQVVLLLDAQGRPLRAVFYALSRRKLKTAYFTDYQEALEGTYPMTLTVLDHLENDKPTVMTYSDFRLEDTPSAWFQPSYLPRLR